MGRASTVTFLGFKTEHKLGRASNKKLPSNFGNLILPTCCLSPDWIEKPYTRLKAYKNNSCYHKTSTSLPSKVYRFLERYLRVLCCFCASVLHWRCSFALAFLLKHIERRQGGLRFKYRRTASHWQEGLQSIWLRLTMDWSMSTLVIIHIHSAWFTMDRV